MCLAIPMRVTKLFAPDKAMVEYNTVSVEISTKLLDQVQEGDYVLVHTGFALEIINQKEAESTLRIFDEIASLNMNDDHPSKFS